MLVRDASIHHTFQACQAMTPTGTAIAKTSRQQDMAGPEWSISPSAAFGARGAKALGGLMRTPMPEAHASAVSTVSMDTGAATRHGSAALQTHETVRT